MQREPVHPELEGALCSDRPLELVHYVPEGALRRDLPLDLEHHEREGALRRGLRPLAPNSLAPLSRLLWRRLLWQLTLTHTHLVPIEKKLKASWTNRGYKKLTLSRVFSNLLLICTQVLVETTL